MRIDPFGYLRPATLTEVCAALAGQQGPVHLLAGGTDLVPRLKQQLVRPAHIIDLTDVGELRYVRSDATGLAIGAGTTLHALTVSTLVHEQAPVLAAAAAKAASQQVRNVATLGGNLCLETRCWFFNQSRAWKKAKPDCFKAGGEVCHVVNKPGVCFAVFQGDTAPALLALDARIRIVSLRGERTIPLAQLYSGNGRAPLTLAPDEILAEVHVPALPAGSTLSYQKFSHRKAVDFPLAGAAVWLQRSGESGRVSGARLALSGVGSAPLLVPTIEVALVGRELTAAAVAEAAEAAVKAARPVQNLHFGPPALRRKMAGIMARLAIEDAGGNGALQVSPFRNRRQEEFGTTAKPKNRLAVHPRVKTFIQLRVNGNSHEAAIVPQSTLLEVLREDLGLTGAKEACGLGACGACTVLIDGKAALSCLMLACTAVGKEITTIEGLADGHDLHPLQQAFLEHGSVQCGFCSPGMILSAKSLLDENPTPGEEEIRLALAGNLCRCTGYANIVEAVHAVAQQGRRKE